MKIALVLPALPLALLAAAAVSAKPGAPPAPGSDEWRAQAVRVCVTGMQDVGDARGIEAVCGCAADRFLARRPAGALPPLAPRDLRDLNASDLAQCAGERSPALASAVIRRVAELAVQQAASAAAPPPAVEPPPQEGAKPDDTAAPAPPQEPKPPAAQPGSLFGGLSLPAWLTDSGLPTWAWVVLAFLVLTVLRGLLRRDDRRDLVAPPSSMRRVASPKPMAQRPPTPPRS